MQKKFGWLENTNTTSIKKKDVLREMENIAIEK